MKKVSIALLGIMLIVSLTAVTSCSSSKGVGKGAGAIAKQEAEQLVVLYLTQRLAVGHPVLANILKTANASTALSTILANGANTNLLSSLIASQFAISQTSVANRLNKGGTLGSLAAFIVQNTDASKLVTLIGKN